MKLVRASLMIWILLGVVLAFLVLATIVGSVLAPHWLLATVAVLWGGGWLAKNIFWKRYTSKRISAIEDRLNRDQPFTAPGWQELGYMTEDTTVFHKEQHHDPLR